MSCAGRPPVQWGRVGGAGRGPGMPAKAECRLWAGGGGSRGSPRPFRVSPGPGVYQLAISVGCLPSALPPHPSPPTTDIRRRIGPRRATPMPERTGHPMPRPGPHIGRTGDGRAPPCPPPDTNSERPSLSTRPPLASPGSPMVTTRARPSVPTDRSPAHAPAVSPPRCASPGTRPPSAARRGVATTWAGLRWTSPAPRPVPVPCPVRPTGSCR